jgi:hypothetical protein
MSAADTMFALAAAHGVSSKMLKTWYEFLPRTPRVLVPIQLEVLVVRQTGAQWARCGMDAPPADGESVDAKNLIPPPFTNLPQPRPRGAYLHWALPDALGHGEQTQTTQPDGTIVSDTTFPVIPDRWLVLRLHPSSIAGRRTVRGWVLRAHDPNPEPLELDAFKETGAPPDAIKKPLTILGHGDVSWSGYYDNVVNRMAFYDNLQGVEVGPLAYLVCGWYSDTSQDPLGDDKIRSLTDFFAKLDELRWEIPEKYLHQVHRKAVDHLVALERAGLVTKLTLQDQMRSLAPFDERPLRVKEPGTTPAGPPYETDGSWWPKLTLYHGSVVGIGWPGIGWPGNEKGTLSGEEGGPPAGSTVKVSVGNTTADALAALVAVNTTSQQQARVLEAFQLGLLPELNDADGRARIDAALHATTFGSLPGGDAMERVFRPPSGPTPTAPKDPLKPGLGVFDRFHRPTRVVKDKATIGLATASREKTSISREVDAKVFQAKSLREEVSIGVGKLGRVIERVAPASDEPFIAGHWEDVKRALPRFFHPGDAVVVLQGLKRSFQYGDDGKNTVNGRLQCRLTGTCTREYTPWHGDIAYPTIHPDDILVRGVDNGSVPPECEELLGEVVLLDPGSSAPVVQSATRGLRLDAGQIATHIQGVMVDQTSWWATRDPRADHSRIVTTSSFGGMLPAAIAVSPPVWPWSPLHLEWRVQFIPSPGGHDDWDLGEVDYNESVPKLPPAASPPGVLTIEGRSTLSAGAAKTLAESVRKAIDQIVATGGSSKLPSKFIAQASSTIAARLLTRVADMRVKSGITAGGVDRSTLEDIATALESMDTLSAGLDGINTALRGGLVGDGTSTPPEGAPVPSPFHVLRAGFMRILRLRLVDCFGQFVDLAGSGPQADADPNRITRSQPLEVTSRPELLALPPRFTSPARLWLRFMDAGGKNEEARLGTDQSPAVSPVCGYLMPNHLDNALMVYAADASDRGVVRLPFQGDVLWEDAPGRPSTVGQSPSLAIPNQFLAGIANGLLQWGIVDAGFVAGPDTALEALMRVIDSTLWSVDPYGHQGEDHLALLIGHPVVVLRAVLRLEVKEPVDLPAVNLKTVPVRLGSLTQWQDGLFGFFVNDDYMTFHCAPAAARLAREVGPHRGFLQQANAVPGFYNTFSDDIDSQGNNGATPVVHPYVDTSGVLFVQPNQDFRLTMLVEPHSLVYGTSGTLPRKDVGMRREWVKDALSKLSPTFRFGPVLIDAKRIRMPIPHDINGTWSWDHRVDVTTWSNDAVTHATQDALLPPDPPTGSEGWLRLTPPQPEEET